MLGVICVRLEMLPLDVAANATDKLVELGTRGITLLSPATADVASVVDETRSCRPTDAMGAAAVCWEDVCEVVGWDRQASSFALLLPVWLAARRACCSNCCVTHHHSSYDICHHHHHCTVTTSSNCIPSSSGLAYGYSLLLLQNRLSFTQTVQKTISTRDS